MLTLIALDQVGWDATQYAMYAPKVSIPDPMTEVRMLRLFPPLIPAEEVIGRTSPLPIVAEPAVFTDRDGRVLALTLPGILPPHRQVDILLSLYYIAP